MTDRNPKAVALYVNVPRNMPNIARVMREGAQEIERLQALCIAQARDLEALRDVGPR